MSPRDVATYVAKAKADPRPPSCARPAKSSASNVRQAPHDKPAVDVDLRVCAVADLKLTCVDCITDPHRPPSRSDCSRALLLSPASTGELPPAGTADSTCGAITGRDQRQSAPIVGGCRVSRPESSGGFKTIP